jgi:hypothetical protein
MHTRLRIIALAALLLAFDAQAQGTPSRITNRRSGVDLFLGGGLSRWSGSSDLGGSTGFSLGVGLERPSGSRDAFRAEFALRGVQSALGGATLTLGRAAVSGQFRRYGARGLFVGGGVTAEVTANCEVSIESDVGSFFGSDEIVECADVENPSIAPKIVVFSALLAAGIERGRYGLDLRVDQDLTAAVETPTGGARSSQISLVARILFGRK